MVFLEKVGKQIRQIWKHRGTVIRVDYDDTDLPYTAGGPRQSGFKQMRGLHRAWFWGHCWCFFNRRGSAHLSVPPLNNKDVPV